MKALICAGITLFSAASIYGVADYYHTKEKGIFKTLYKEAQVSKGEQTLKEKETGLEDYSRAKTGDGYEIKKAVTINTGNTLDNSTKTFINKKKNIRKRPKIRFSDFSRSALVVEMPAPITDSSTQKY